MKDWDKLEQIIACPFTREPLRRFSDSAVGVEAGHTFPLVGRVPVLRGGPVVQVKDPNHLSNPLPPAVREMMLACPGNVLFLGAGGSEFRGDRVFEVEYNLFRNTDVIADAHRLPFRDGVFELVVAMNVFEHLREPHVASAELHRVLALGGKALIRTAFLQILHEEPNHFFGATEFGVRQWFRQFSAIDVQVSPNFNPFFGMAWMMHELLQAVEVSLGAESRKELENVTLGEVGARWPERVTTQSPVLAMLSRLPQEVQARFAAGFEMWATK